MRVCGKVSVLGAIRSGAAMFLSLLLPGCGEEIPSGPASHPPAGAIRGIHLVDWTASGYGSGEAKTSISAIESTGANLLTLVITAYQESPGTSSIILDDPRTASRDAVAEAVFHAQTLGLDVALKPHVDLIDGTWRGNIVPADPAAWFDDYEAFILPWADLADSMGVELFLAGTELAGTVRHESAWREIIATLRNHFRGEISYAASWDEAGLVPFWDAFDYVGIDFYFPVAHRENPGRLELLAGWQVWLDRLERLHHQADLPLLITEIGYRSVNGSGEEPWSFTGETAEIDTGEQADLYWAALEATAGIEWIDGLIWWNWLAAGGGGSENRDYTPHGKPAEEELRRAWGG